MDREAKVTNPAIIFDCDGVLVNSEQIAIEVERQHLARLGTSYDLETYLTRFVGLTDVDFHRELERDFSAFGIGKIPSDFAAVLKAETYRRFEDELSSIDGIEAFLDNLDGPRAVASSSALEGLHRKLHITGLHGYFDPHIYAGEQVEQGKPEPDLFLFAASRLGRDPNKCLIIEDSVHGVQAGLAAGMTVWGFTGGGHADAGLSDRLRRAGAHQVFTRFSDMPTEFE